VADIQPIPDFLQFVNFDGRLTGATAQIVKQVAAAREISPADLLNEILAEALADKFSPHAVKATDVKVQPMTINAGNGGFHVMTVVADGYGDLVAEDSSGAEQARVSNRPNATLADLIADLVRQVAANKSNPHVG
jgi:hypothetical protein